MILYAALVLEL